MPIARIQNLHAGQSVPQTRLESLAHRPHILLPNLGHGAYHLTVDQRPYELLQTRSGVIGAILLSYESFQIGSADR